MNDQTQAQKKLTSYLLNKGLDITEKDIPSLLSSIKRFVKVIQKIYTEPQVKITITERRHKGKTIRDRVFSTNLEEFKKVSDKNDPQESTVAKFRKLHEITTKDKYGR